MDEFIKKITPKYMSTAMIEVDEFLESYKHKKCEFVDIRMDFEKEAWGVNFGLHIPLNELENRLNELPKDKLIVLGCPTGPRSIVGWTFLSSKGINVKFLKGGLDSLTSEIKGDKARKIMEYIK